MPANIDIEYGNVGGGRCLQHGLRLVQPQGETDQPAADAPAAPAAEEDPYLARVRDLVGGGKK